MNMINQWHIQANILNITRQSVAVQRDGASRLAKKIPIITHSGNAFLSYFYSKKSQPISVENYYIGNNLHLC